MFKSPKHPSLVSLILGVKRVKNARHHIKIGSFLQFNIIIKRVVHEFNMKVLILTVVWHEYDVGIC